MRADRLLSLLFLLQSNGRMTARDLAARLEISERTVYRDIEALGMAGVPVYAERGPGGGCGLIDGYKTNVTGMTEDEIRTLFVANVAGPLKDLGLGRALEAAMLKLLASLPAPRRHVAAHARQRVYVDAAGWYRNDEPLTYLPVLQDAVWQDRRVKLTYQHGDTPSTRLIDPYGLVAKASIWYVVGAQMDGEMRSFRVSRVRHAEMLDDTFERPPDFDLPSYWEASSANYVASWERYPVTLRIPPDYIEEMPYIFGLRVRDLIRAATPDDQGNITITVHFESWEYARGRIIALGTHVEALDPPELREELRRMAAEVAAFYAATAPVTS